MSRNQYLSLFKLYLLFSSLMFSFLIVNLLLDSQELVTELDNLHGALETFRKEKEDGEEMALHGFEVAALMNLVATDTMVEEAQALIPSLCRFPESAVDEILDLIRSTMIRIVSYGGS